MAILREMLVQGIRSIGPDSDDAHTIKFLHPLTIICGPNGSGKTTLIEALNYITTDVKPAGQLHSFLHSLEVCNRSRVDGLVKLRFTASNGSDVVATKRMNVSRGKNGKLMSKSDEFTLSIVNKFGEKRSLSAKVADTKSEILNLLDVPRAILNSVVFCHQENSTWPLGEPKLVKDRFDAIFELTRYVKTALRLKSYRKALETRFQVLCERENTLVYAVEDKSKKEAELAELRTRKNEIVTAVQDWESRKGKAAQIGEDCEGELRLLTEHEGKRRDFEQQVTLWKGQLEMVDVQDFAGDENELKIEIDRLENSSEFRSIDKKRNTLRQKVEELENNRGTLNGKKTVVESTRIQLLSKREQKHKAEKEITDNENCLRREFGFSSSDTVLVQLKAVIDDERQELEKLTLTARREVQSCEEQKDDIVRHVQSLQFELKANRESRNSCAEEIRRLSLQLERAQNVASELPGIQSRIEKLESQRSCLPEVDIAQIERATAERIRAQEELNIVRQMCSEAEECEAAERERERKSDELVESKGKLNSLIDKHTNDFQIAWGGVKHPLPLTARVHKMANRAEEEMSQEQEQLRHAEKELDGKRFLDKQKEKEEQEINADIRRLDVELEKLAPDVASDEVETSLGAIRTKLNKTRRELAPLNAKSVIYDSWSEETIEKQCCPLCERRFPSKAGAKGLSNKLAELLKEMPVAIELLTNEVSNLEEKEIKLAKAAEKVEQTRRLRDERLSKVLSERSSATADIKKLQRNVSVHAGQLEKVKRLTSAIKNIQMDVSMMDALHESVTRLSKEVDDLSSSSSGTVRNLAELKEKRESLEREIATLTRKTDQLQQTANERNKIAEQLNALNQQRLDLGQDAATASLVQQQIGVKKGELSELENKLAGLQDQLPSLREQESDAIQQRKDVERRFKEKIQKKETQIRVLEQHLRDLDRLRLACNELGSSSNLEADILENNNELREVERQIEECGRMIESLRAELASSDGVQTKKRLLEQQLQRINFKRKIKEAQDELDRLGAWTGMSRQKLEEKLNKARDICDKWTKRISEQSGQQTEINMNIKKLTEELAKDTYRKADSDYMGVIVEKVVSEAAIEDLKTYAIHLEEAILDYHRTKMRAVNEILENLWRRVYRGTDINAIKIKSELSPGSGDRNKYDYYVMMVLEGGAEIEMRERCSAGQKMLASILIRVALSDVFGGKCSILALDEPTTNLDIQKIDDMVDMLIDLINARRADDGDPEDARQFQLIIITHDERFVSKMQRAIRPEYVYHVSKNESGRSELERIRTIGGDAVENGGDG